MKSKYIPVLAVLLVAGLFLGIYLANDFKPAEPPVPDSPAGDRPPGEERRQESMERMNLLILGLDSRGNERGRADTIMIAGFNPERDEITLLSIPRDTRVKVKGAWEKINAAYFYGGEELTQQSLEDFLGIKIDHYAILDFKGFEQLVDIVGGIEVDVPVRMYYPEEGIDLEPGLQTLNGRQALGYARYRYTADGDIGRAKRQQQVVQLLMEKLLRLRNVVKLPQLVKALAENVETDIPASQMLSLAKAAQQANEKPVNAMVLPGENRKIEWRDGNKYWFYLPDEAKVAEISALFQ